MQHFQISLLKYPLPILVRVKHYGLPGNKLRG
jgi:hypothetical protein